MAMVWRGCNILLINYFAFLLARRGGSALFVIARSCAFTLSYLGYCTEAEDTAVLYPWHVRYDIGHQLQSVCDEEIKAFNGSISVAGILKVLQMQCKLTPCLQVKASARLTYCCTSIFLLQSARACSSVFTTSHCIITFFGQNSLPCRMSSR